MAKVKGASVATLLSANPDMLAFYRAARRVTSVPHCKRAKFFTVTFTKTDGSERTMVCDWQDPKDYQPMDNARWQAAAAKRLETLAEGGMIQVRDVEKDAHRTFNLNTIKSARVGRKVWSF